jgi:hypothetical protein
MQSLQEVAADAKAATAATEEEGKTQALPVTSFSRRKGPEVREKEAAEQAASLLERGKIEGPPSSALQNRKNARAARKR